MVGEKGKVISTEIVPELVNLAKSNLAKNNIGNVQVVETDGSRGYKEESPYDRIVLTCACPAFPKPCLDQLKEDGIILAPIGDRYSQTMVKGIKKKGKIKTENLGPFVFVPLRGKYGFSEEL